MTDKRMAWFLSDVNKTACIDGDGCRDWLTRSVGAPSWRRTAGDG